MGADDDTPSRQPVDPWELLPPWLRAIPADLAVVIGLTAVTDVLVLAPLVRDTPLRVVFGLPFVLFIPGYTLVAALFPERGPDRDSADVDAEDEGKPRPAVRERGIDGIERVALSFGLSIAIVPLIGLVLNFTPWGIRLVPIVVSVSLFTLVTGAIAVQRRQALPVADRFRVPYERWFAVGWDELVRPDTRTDAALNVLLVVSVLLAMASVGYAVVVPKQGEAFTEFYLLTETDDGDLVAADYPTELRRGESKPLIIGVGNHEHRPLSYAIVIELHRVRVVGNSTRVESQAELDRLRTPRLASNHTWHHNYSITPPFVGQRLRLTFLLYRDAPPANATIQNAYRETHLWINVTE